MLKTLLCCLGLTLLAADEPQYRLTLEENFDGPTLDPKIWNIETGKRRDSMNAASAVDVKDGVLTITTWTDEQGVTYCGFVTTRKKFHVAAGKTEARCRFSVQPGTQVCFWLQSPTYGKSGKADGVGEDGAEIDIMETTGMKKGGYQYAIHWGPYNTPEKRKTFQDFPKPVGQDWHVYGLEWNETGYHFSFDGKVVATNTQCPPTKAPEFLLFTSESSIKSWSGERPKEGYGSKEKSQNKFSIDWVKVWERIPAAGK